METRRKKVVLYESEETPGLVWQDVSRARRMLFEKVGKGRREGEFRWEQEVSVPVDMPFQFRISWDTGRVIRPGEDIFFSTCADQVWIQDGQFFDYRPAPRVSPSRVHKIPEFAGSLPPRALYVYLPRGYDEHLDRRYPVLYMHDGQNCFEAFHSDSFAGTWRAERAADAMIAQAKMRECLIVGVSNGQDARMYEYLPDFASLPVDVFGPPPQEAPQPDEGSPPALDLPTARTPSRELPTARTPSRELRAAIARRERGRASQTARYYRDEVAPYIEGHYRALASRQERATCGSSMGGLMSLFLGWEMPEFAKHHAALSTSFWLTRDDQGQLPWIERLRSEPRRDIRLWLDSGTGDGADNDDGMKDAILAKQALLENGYRQGEDLFYFLDQGAGHHEFDWAARLPRILAFLFPPKIG